MIPREIMTGLWEKAPGYAFAIIALFMMHGLLDARQKMLEAILSGQSAIIASCVGAKARRAELTELADEPAKTSPGSQ